MEAILHMSAQSLHIIMHLPIIPIISLFDIVMHSVQQASHAIAHSLQLSMQLEYCWFFNIEETVVLFIVFVCAKNYISISKKYDKNTNYMQILHIFVLKCIILLSIICKYCIYLLRISSEIWLIIKLIHIQELVYCTCQSEQDEYDTILEYITFSITAINSKINQKAIKYN
jgi:hypothetical protein